VIVKSLFALCLLLCLVFCVNKDEAFERVPDSVASGLFGGSSFACDDYDPAICLGQAEGCVTTACWGFYPGGSITNHKVKLTTSCGVNDCGNVKRLEDCDTGFALRDPIFRPISK
jgi:hypothetical protein